VKGKHPSGRPIRTPAKRDYSMQAHRYTGFRCPRLNEPAIPRITSATDIHAVGFIDHRVGYLAGWEDSAKGSK
jgi:hypothetical protein